jgi:hypothetical protein
MLQHFMLMLLHIMLFVQDDESDDDWSMGSKKAGKKGRGTGTGSSKAKGGGGKAAAGSSTPGKQSSRGGTAAAAADGRAVLSAGVLQQRLLELFPDMEDAGLLLLMMS